MTAHGCRPDCGACCSAPSISSPIPGMPGGKPAGVRCIHLTSDLLCAIWNQPDRPLVCAAFPFKLDHCGSTRDEALSLLAELERLTRPESADLK